MIKPSVDQVVAQLRVLIPVVGTLVTMLGAPAADVGSWTQLALSAVGPISYFAVMIWSLVANTRASILKSAAKPGGPGLDPPQIVLPKEEAGLAYLLPANVNTSETVKVVPK